MSTFGSEPGDLAGELEPGDVGRPTRRGRVEAGALREVGAVQARAVHTDEYLAVARLGIGPGLDHELLIGDHERAHAETLLPDYSLAPDYWSLTAIRGEPIRLLRSCVPRCCAGRTSPGCVASSSTFPVVAAPALAFLDDEGEELLLDADEASRCSR